MDLTERRANDPAPVASIENGASLSPVERAVLLTVLYADVFDYALTPGEVYRRLICHRCRRLTVERAIQALERDHLSVSDEFITLKGREHLRDLRRTRTALGAQLWPVARRYARWLARVPFMRMVAVSGSLAANNAAENTDVDIFCVTASHRLWVTRLFIVPLSKMTRLFDGRFPHYLCPNYLLTLDSLEVVDKNLFTAHEVMQAVPLYGEGVHRRFLAANSWVVSFLPQRRLVETPQADDPSRPSLTRLCEWLLGGDVGDWLDAAAHRVFVAFYRRRAARRGWPWPRLQNAYQRTCYTVPEGGYARTVRRLFDERVHERLGRRLTERELERFFGRDTAGLAGGVYDWDGLFQRDYGAAKRPTTDAARQLYPPEVPAT